MVEAAVSPQIADFLCEQGMRYYQWGRYPQALAEFKKALLANPESSIAKEFIAMLEHQKGQTTTPSPLSTDKISNINSFLDQFERIQRSGPKENLIVQELEQAIVLEKKVLIKEEKPVIAKDIQETLINLNKEGQQLSELETNIGERLILRGKNISRFLVTQPVLMNVAQQSPDELLIEPKELGATYLHLWDDGGRKTIRFMIGPRKLEQEFFREAKERYGKASLPETFKASYSIEGDTLMSGRGFGDQQRKSYSLAYGSSITGETPFGRFDTAVRANRTPSRTYRVSNLRMGLTGAHYDQLQDMDIRWFDFTPTYNAFGFPTSDLRGVMVDAPMHDKQIHYQTFWGAIPLGNFTTVSSSSGLDRTKKAWLEGLGLNYKLSHFANFKTFYAHSYGSQLTEPVLTNDVEGFGMDYNFGRFNIGSEMAYDGRKDISYTANSSFTLPKVRLGLSMTENNKNFASLLGGAPTTGSTSGTLTLNYRPTSAVTITNSFSGAYDKVFYNPARPGRPNYNALTQLNWVLDTHTELDLGYTMDDHIGSISPSVTETKEVRIRKKLFFLKKLSTFLSYQNTKNKNYSSPAQDSNNNRILAGLNFRLISELYFYYTKELNFLRNKFSSESAQPTAQELGFNFYHQVFDTPFYSRWRIFYRDEEDTESTLSYLGGEDRLEGETELTFKPNPDSEVYLKGRITNVWAEKVGVAKHLDIDISWGMRLLWDTGLRWQPRGGFYGYVFYDVNGDGIKQAKEKGIKGVEVKGPEGKTSITDAAGYYKISDVVGKKAVLEINLKTVPKGYSPATAITPEVDVVHAKTKRVDFGFSTRTEISGLVFLDKNNNGEYDAQDETFKGVVIILDGKQKTATRPLGEYMFRGLSSGEHTLTLDLKTIPVKFLPKVPVSKKINIIEGATFVYNIPLQESK